MNGKIRIRSHLHSTFFLEPMRVGESHIELKVEIYEMSDGLFSSSVFAKRAFLFEEAYLSGIEKESERRGMVEMFVEDQFYDTTKICCKTCLEALEKTLQMIREQLLKSGESIEYLSDLKDSNKQSEEE